MTRDEQRLYCYLPVDHKLPPPKKTRPGEWFSETGDVSWFHYPWLLEKCKSYSALFEVELDTEQYRLRLARQIGTIDEHTVRLFMIACAEHVLPVYEKHYTDGAARRAINAAMEYEATGADVSDASKSGLTRLFTMASARYEPNRAMCAAWMCTAFVIPENTVYFAEEASRAVRADKRPDEKAWQLKAFLKVVKRQHKEKK